MLIVPHQVVAARSAFGAEATERRGALLRRLDGQVGELAGEISARPCDHEPVVSDGLVIELRWSRRPGTVGTQFAPQPTSVRSHWCLLPRSLPQPTREPAGGRRDCARQSGHARPTPARSEEHSSDLSGKRQCRPCKCPRRQPRLMPIEGSVPISRRDEAARAAKRLRASPLGPPVVLLPSPCPV